MQNPPAASGMMQRPLMFAVHRCDNSFRFHLGAQRRHVCQAQSTGAHPMILPSEPNPIRRLFCITVLLAGAASVSPAGAAAPTATTHATGVLRIATAHAV